MSKYWQKQLEAAIFGRVWEMVPSYLDAILEWDAPPNFMQVVSRAPASEKKSPYKGRVERSDNGRHAVMGISGPLYSNPGECAKDFFGVADLEDINHDLEVLGNDPKLETVILNIDSPGGVAGPSAETAELVRELGKEKRVVAYSGPGSMMASAAYKIAAGANEIKASDYADIGSIGTYMALRDSSEKWAKEGNKLHLFRSGKYKAMGMPGKPMTEEEQALCNQEVEALATKFRRFVRENRPGVAESAMEGQTLAGRAAREAGLIDGTRRNLALVVADEIRRAL